MGPAHGGASGSGGFCATVSPLSNRVRAGGRAGYPPCTMDLSRGPRLRDLALAGGWLLLDQGTKFLAERGLSRPVTLVPHCLRLSLSHNRGALFGFLAAAPDPWRGILLTALPVLAIAGIAWLLLRAPLAERFGRLGLALILGGAAGNVIDRLVHGHVIDFIDVYAGWEAIGRPLVRVFGTNRWPTFNVADVGLTCGAALLFYEVFLRRAPRSGGPRRDGDGVSLPR